MRTSSFSVLFFSTLILAACSSDNAKTPDGGTVYTNAPSGDVSCNTDSDCCVAIDTCHSIAYVVHSGDTLQIPQNGCNFCIAPAVQVWCSGGKCQNMVVPTSANPDQQLLVNHCGYVGPDAGQTSSDAGSHGCQ
jgi:hypothetical protein